MAETEIIDAELVAGPTVAALARQDGQHGALTVPVATHDQIVAAFRAYQETCRALLDESDYQAFWEKGKESKFKKRSAWRKLAVAYSVTFQIVERVVLRDDSGEVYDAEFVARAVAPNGRFADGWGACSGYERCCENGCDKQIKQSWHRHCVAATGDQCSVSKHFSKPRHDIPATAETRAKNRACADLFGMGEVSAEEIGHLRADDDEPPAAVLAPPVESVTVAHPPSGEPWPDEPPDRDEPEPAGQPPSGPPAKKAPPATASLKCPNCGSPVEQHTKQGDDDTKPLYKCTNSRCGGGADKKPPGKGKWPWASWDANAFAHQRPAKPEPESVGPFDVSSSALAEAERLIKGAARIIREAPVGKVEQHVGALAGALVMGDWWPQGIVESSLKLFAAHLRGSPAKFPGCEPDELNPGVTTRWDQLGSDKNIRLFAAWIVREAEKQVAHQKQQPEAAPSKIAESLWA